jgi:hypothetical protein
MNTQVPEEQQFRADSAPPMVVPDTSPAPLTDSSADVSSAGAPLPTSPQDGERSRRWLRSAIFRTLRCRRLSRRAAITSMLAEQHIIGARRHPSTRSHAETVISSLGKAAGDTVLDKAQPNLDRLAAKTDLLRAEQRSLAARAEQIPEKPIPHPYGGVRTVADTSADHDQLHAQIRADISRGSLRHRRLPKVLRHAPVVIFTCDALLLFYFFSGVTNVDWTSPLSVALVFAVALAAIVTGLAFLYCRYVGDRLRHYKKEEGTVSFAGMDGWTKTSAALAIVIVTVIAPLMFIRLRTEVLDDLGPQAQGTAIVVGLALAVISILAVFVTIAVHALDGSPETDWLDELGNAIAGPLSEQAALRQHVKELNTEIARNVREAERIAARATVRPVPATTAPPLTGSSTLPARSTKAWARSLSPRSTPTCKTASWATVAPIRPQKLTNAPFGSRCTTSTRPSRERTARPPNPSARRQASKRSWPGGGA